MYTYYIETAAKEYFAAHAIYGKNKEEGMEISSSAFNQGEMIPKKYSCDGQDISPPLKFVDVPGNSTSLVLISDDPDAPMGTWVHWVVYNLAADTENLPENVSSSDLKDRGAKLGMTSFGRPGYGGPCPPGGTHRYFFKLYALDISLSLSDGAAKQEVLAAMEGHILAETELMGKYRR